MRTLPATTITVAMLIQRYYPHVGGAETQLRALVPRLLARGVRPVIVTRGWPSLPVVERLDGALVFRLPTHGGKLFAASEYLVRSLVLLRRLGRRVDVLHAHELLSPATVGLLAKWLGGQPLIAKVLRGGELSDLRALRRRPLGHGRWTLYRRQVDRFIAISHEIERELLLEGVPPGQIARIPNGVDVERYTPLDGSRRRQLRQHLGLLDAPTAVFAGRLAAEKRVDSLVACWPQVRARVPQAQLLVVGDGPLAPDLARLSSPGVFLLGRHDSVRPFLQASDVLALPSMAEGLSNAMLEAMSCGLACLVHPVGGAVDVLEDGRSGRFLPDATADGLVQGLVELLADPARCERLGAAARQRVVEAYSIEATAEALVCLYREVVAGRAAPPPVVPSP